MFIAIKTTSTSPHDGNLGLKELDILVHNIFLCLVGNFTAPRMLHKRKRSPYDTFFRTYDPNCVPEISLTCLQNMHISYQGNVNFQFVPF